MTKKILKNSLKLILLLSTTTEIVWNSYYKDRVPKTDVLRFAILLEKNPQPFTYEVADFRGIMKIYSWIEKITFSSLKNTQCYC